MDKEEIFTSYIRPRLEYASPVFPPRLEKHIELIEKVQKAIRIVIEIREPSHRERLVVMNLPTLKEKKETS